jgi:cytochrome c553
MNLLRSLHHLLLLVLVLLAALFSSLAWAQAATPAGAPAVLHDTMAQRMLACTVCHGREGRATSSGYFPRIAGKPAGYLYNQLTHFREGRRQNAAMAALLHTLSDDYLRDISEHIAALDLPYPPPQRHTASAAVLKRGEALVRQGDPQRNIPACNACHGAAMTGVSPAMPGLLGLPRDYLLGQLGAWQTGLRHAAEPDCMAQVAKALSVDDVSAVATWLASQPLPANTKPAATIARPLPLRCGSDQP